MVQAVLRVAALLLTRCGAWHLVRHTHAASCVRCVLRAMQRPSAEALAAAARTGAEGQMPRPRAASERHQGSIDRTITRGHGADAAEEGSWASLGLDGATQQRLEHARPTPIQAAAFDSLKSGKDGVLHAETGSGKTLAYALPLMKKRVLVLTPSTSLADQISEVVDQFTESFAVHTPKEVLKAEDDLDSIDVIVLDEVDALLRAPGRYAAAEQKKHRRERPAAKILRRFHTETAGRASCWSVGYCW